MIIYQSNYQDVQLQNPANLIITSIPILELEQGNPFYKWLSTNLNDNCNIIFDVPDKVHFKDYARYLVRGKLQHQVYLTDFYEEGEIQQLLFYSNTEMPTPDFSYRECYHRDMKHPCEFDETLITCLIKQYSEVGDVVIDPFCGTGTVPRVAHQLGRVGIGIDLRCPYTNEL